MTCLKQKKTWTTSQRLNVSIRSDHFTSPRVQRVSRHKRGPHVMQVWHSEIPRFFSIAGATNKKQQKHTHTHLYKDLKNVNVEVSGLFFFLGGGVTFCFGRMMEVLFFLKLNGLVMSFFSLHDEGSRFQHRPILLFVSCDVCAVIDLQQTYSHQLEVGSLIFHIYIHRYGACTSIHS